MEQIFGGSPLAVLVRLIVLSVIVGIVFSALNIRPEEFFSALQRIAVALWDFSFAWFGSVGRYFVTGAVIVVPIWVVLRLLGIAKTHAKPGTPAAGPPRSPSPFRER